MPERRRLLPHVSRSLHAVASPLLRVLNALAVGAQPWPLLLYGPAGTGKTCAALAMADVTDTAAYIEADDWASFTIRKADEVDAELAHLGGKELLIVDEIGCRDKVGDLAYTSLKKLIDVRARSETNATIFISNIEPARILELFDDRIYSRLTCGTVFHLTGDDRRAVRQ